MNKPVLATDSRQTSAWGLTLALAGVHFTSAMDRHVVALLLPPLKQELGLSDTQLGLLHGSAYTLLYALAILPFGMAADRVNRRALVAAAGLLWSAGTAAFAFADSFTQLFAARLLVGLGQAALVPAAISLISDAFDGRRIGRPIAVFTSASALGRAAALLGGGALLVWLAASGFSVVAGAPWRSMLVLSLGVNALVLGLLMLAREPPRRQAVPIAVGDYLPGLRANRRDLLAIFGGAAAAILLIQSITAWMPSLLVRRFALSTADSGLLAGVIVLAAGPLGNLAGGVLLDRLEPRVAAAAARVLAMALLATGLTAPAIALAPTLTGTVAGLLLAGFFLGMATPAGLTGVQQLTPPALRGKVTAGFVSGVTLVALGIGPLLIGWMSESLFSGADSLSLALLCAITVCSVLGAAAVYPWRRR